MSITMTRTGKYYDLYYFLARDGGTWLLGLFDNNVTFDDSSYLVSAGGNLNEASYSGYARQAFGTWSMSIPAAGQNAKATNSLNNIFSPSGTLSPSVTIYGWFVMTGPSDPLVPSNVLFGDNLATPFVMTDTSTILVLVPVFQVGTLP